MEVDIEKYEAENFRKLDKIIAQYKEQRGMLIRILQKSQEVFGYLPLKVQAYIAEKLDIPISTVNGVVSFYSLFSQEPQGKYTVSVCLGTACYVKGAQEILEAIKKELQIDVGETTMDNLFTLKATRCIGACGLAPVITINDDIYGRLTPADIPSILYKYTSADKKARVTH
ncbi:NADH-quinone oxidoreductase subunit E/NADH-quinone oxidoreductase subunit F/NADP-reducing hydrogenase subunit HndA [Desulfohalotomaculum tongense]|uniref:NADH-quinone oxidoreductase subunit NuoE n=1 Tax=Desulforadius tongensis TaxID=1216062 RepID=UPI001958EE41|nr:NADH-quinone oxidoreductase subunit NuoE [Desulforadius tongensis]MBM7855609.1 NADH-quinone oxidoreductase subunit E/NADH-quinone oxidoreductase subunit F/NADP-reducing hydrogenase subunit HndA [Desulforadius tongensis]